MTRFSMDGKGHALQITDNDFAHKNEVSDAI